jgi:hypothetical protein
MGWKQVRLNNLRVSGDHPIPWIVYGATDFLEHTVPPKARVLELGGGGSTLFWLNRGNTVVTIETDSGWHKKLVCSIGKNQNWTSHIVEEISPSALDDLGLGQFEVIVNDFNGDRTAVTSWAESNLSDGGYIVWDNSDRPLDKAAVDQLKVRGLGHIDFFGLSPINSFATQTSVLSRSLVSPHWEIREKRTVEY